MTIIAAIHEPGVGTWIGSDTMSSHGDGSASSFTMDKWVIRGDGVALGVSGSVMVMRALHELFLAQDAKLTAFKFSQWMLGVLCDTLKLKAGEKEGRPPWYDVNAILAWPGGIESFDTEGGAVSGAPNELVAMGSGTDFAVGAAYALRSYHGSNASEDRLREALNAAIRYGSGCGGDAWVRLLKATP